MQIQLPSSPARRWYLLGILLLLVLGGALRLLQLGEYPVAANHDELSNVYDGYCLARTGADRWGEPYPLILRGFGQQDYRPPLYAWLCALPIGMFGFSLEAGRLISALLGCASLGLLYLVARRLGGRGYAAAALLLAVLSPWHIVYSRLASEGTMLPPFFLIAACYLWQRAYARRYAPAPLAWLGLSIGLGTNTYQAGKLLFLLLALGVLLDLRRGGPWLRRAVVFGAGCLLGAGPQLLALITRPEQFFSRADGSLMPFSWSFQYLNDLLNHLSLHLAPEFLFFSFGAYNNLAPGRLLLVEFFVFYLGLFLLGRVVRPNQALRPGYLYLLLLAAILPSALTVDSPHALRASGLTVLLPLVSAAGLSGLYRAIRRPRRQQLFAAGAAGLILANGLYYGLLYADSLMLQNQGMQALVTAYSRRLAEYKSQYDAVLIEDFGLQPYIYVAAFGELTPREFQQADKQVEQGPDWDRFRKLDKFYFLAPEELSTRLRELPGRKLLLLRQPRAGYREIDRVEAASETVYFYETVKAP